VRKVQCNDLVKDVEHLHGRSAAFVPTRPILIVVRLYNSSLSYLLDSYASGVEECVLTPRRWFDENPKLQQQEFLGVLSERLDKGQKKALRAVFPSILEGPSGMGMRGSNRSSGSSGPSGERAPNAM
jgi:hypothetical protein